VTKQALNDKPAKQALNDKPAKMVNNHCKSQVEMQVEGEEM
jgi:hypothetical protein